MRILIIRLLHEIILLKYLKKNYILRDNEVYEVKNSLSTVLCMIKIKKKKNNFNFEEIIS